MGSYRHWGAARQIGITGNGDVDDLDEPDDMEFSLVAPWHGGQWGLRKLFEYLRSLRNPNILQRGLNADFLDGKHGASYVTGPASSTVCNLPCFVDESGNIQDTGLSSADLLLDGRASATPALADKFGFWDADDGDDPKTATLSALKTALGVVTDHGGLSGLADDDHTLYAKGDPDSSSTAGNLTSFLNTDGRSLEDSGIAASNVALKDGAGVVQKLEMEVSRADLNALGAVTSGEISFGGQTLPAGAIPLHFRVRNGGTAFTSSGGTVSNLTAGIVESGQTTRWLGDRSSLHQANQRGAQSTSIASTTQEDFPYESTLTPAVYFTVSGSGVNFGNLTDGDDGLFVELFYVEKP